MSVLKLKNSYTKSVEIFQPLDPSGERVTMYSCGPTVYSYAHIGNFRSFLMSDLLRRVLERNGYEVRHVMNITDVGHLTEDDVADAQGEDKLQKAAREMGWDPYKLARHYEDAFVEDARKLRMKNYSGGEASVPELHPRAAGHVPEMLALIQKLIENDYAYVDASGQVYYDIAKFPDYGKLSGKVIDELEAGARVAVGEHKRDPRDFYLWKVDPKHLMQWDPHSEKGWDAADYERYRQILPHGVDERIKPGFPGWHIECSAMSRAHLGALIDIHTGGEDNIFPHHECEIAQSYGAYSTHVPGPHGAPDEGSPRNAFARYWVHGRFLLVNNKKMSKRDGTFYTVRDLLDPRAAERPDLADELAAAGFKDGKVPANVLRYALISNQYTQQMNFSVELLKQARASVERMQTRYDKLRETVGDGTNPDNDETASDRVLDLVNKYEQQFDDALNDNLNTPNALAAVFGAINELNTMELGPAEARESLRLMESFDEVLDVLDKSPRRMGSQEVGDQQVMSVAKEAHLAKALNSLDTVEAVVRLLVDDDMLPASDAEQWFTQFKERAETKGPMQSEEDEWFWAAFEQGIYPVLGKDLLAEAWLNVVARLRQAARTQKQYGIADRLRRWLEGVGAVVEDTKHSMKVRPANVFDFGGSDTVVGVPGAQTIILGEAKYTPERGQGMQALETVLLRMKAVQEELSASGVATKGLLLVTSTKGVSQAERLLRRFGMIGEVEVRVIEQTMLKKEFPSDVLLPSRHVRYSMMQLEAELPVLARNIWPNVVELGDSSKLPLGFMWDWVGYVPRGDG